MGFNPTDVFLVLGRRGCGKSYLGRKIQDCYPRKVIFDTLGEYTEADGTLTNTFQQFCYVLMEHTKAQSRQFTIIFQFDPERADNTEEFDQALRVLFHRGKLTGQNVLVVIEEVQNFASVHQMPQWLRNSLLIGRHANQALLFTSQRCGEVHKTVISQAHHVFAGQMQEKNDVEYCRYILGDKAFELQKLPPRRFLYYQPDGTIVLVNNTLTSSGALTQN